jgi:Dyp-type peroxidase family
MAAQTSTANGPKQDSAPVQELQKLQEIYADAPEVGRVALEMIMGELETTARSRRRAATAASRLVSGLHREIKPGGAERLWVLLEVLGNNFQARTRGARCTICASSSSMIQSSCSPRRMKGERDPYIGDFATKIPDALDVLLCDPEGYAGMQSPAVRDWIASNQITADAWCVANPNLTVTETRRLQRTAKPMNDPAPGKDAPMSSVNESVDQNLSAPAPTLELDEIQATVLRQRPAPYFGTHAFLHVDDAQAGRAFLRRLIPYVDSAAGWSTATKAWLAVAITYTGLEALGLPQASLQSFPEEFRVGMARRARQLGDDGVNDPKNWDKPFGDGQIHIGLSAFSDTEEKWRRAVGIAREQREGISGINVLFTQDFGQQPGDRNSLGYKDGIDQPAIEGSGAEPLPGQGRPIKAGEFILGYPGEVGAPLPMPQPDILGRNGTYVGLRKYQSRVGAFNRFLRANGSTEQERELVAAKLVGRWRSGAPLTLAPDADNPALGADLQRNNDFDYANDPHGRQVPLGAHIRRMNPRDTKLTRLTDVNIHRLIRRGTTFGPPYDPNELSQQDDEVPRGAIFLFISAKAMATIEFLQQEWINDGDFIGANGERDPIIGRQKEGATFTIPKEPVRRRLHGIETFSVLRGGEYFFMPSISALSWLANLNL